MPLTTRTFSSNDLYQSHLQAVGSDVDFWPIWRVGQAAYERLGNGRLQPLSVAAFAAIAAAV